MAGEYFPSPIDGGRILCFGRWLGLGGEGLLWTHFIASGVVLVISNIACIVSTWDGKDCWAEELEAAQGARRAKAEEERQKLREHVNKILDEATK